MPRQESARRIYLSTLAQLEVATVMRRHIRLHSGHLEAGKTIYAMDDFDRIRIVSVGKAAVAMAATFLEILGPQIALTVDGIVVGTSFVELPHLKSMLGGHPLPDQHSLRAGAAVLEFLADSHRDDLIFFLVSGGASAMLEQPLDPKMTLADVAALHQALVHSGLRIEQMNAVRKHFSAVKGGRLAVAAGEATMCTLLISDVPSHTLHSIGSGPTLPDPSTVADCRQIIDENQQILALTDRVARFFAGNLPETPKQAAAVFQRSTSFALLSSEDLCSEAARFAALEGYHVVVDNSCDEWLYDDAAGYLLARLDTIRKKHGRTCLLSAGEISVRVTSGAGVGGRNQHFVLECAVRMAMANQQATVLSAGTDGIDGNSFAAGGLADETTVARAEKLGWNIAAAVAKFDSNTVLEALGDTVVTGPSGNNVRDLRILLSDG
jgi:glycerate 2-kinase